MEFMNIVRAKVKPDHLDEYIELNKEFPKFKGMLESKLVKTDDYTFYYVGTWESEEAIAAQRDNMIANLDKMRHMLELSPELGLTDPVSGSVVVSK